MVLAGRRVSELEKTAAMADKTGGRTLVVQSDVSQPDSVNALFDRIRSELDDWTFCLIMQG